MSIRFTNYQHIVNSILSILPHFHVTILRYYTIPFFTPELIIEILYGKYNIIIITKFYNSAIWFPSVFPNIFSSINIYLSRADSLEL